MRLSLALLALVLSACDTADPLDPICLLGPETEVEGGVDFVIRSPQAGDTLRVGEPFRFVADVEAVGDVRSMAVQLTTGDLFGPSGVLFERALDVRVGTYVVDQTIVLDAVRAGADLSEVYVFGTGEALINTACGGAYGNGGGTLAPVTVLR